MSHKTPTEVAALIVPRLLAGESMTRRSIQRDYRVKRAVVSRAIRLARNTLFSEHMAILPIAHDGNGFTLDVTTLPRVMYRSELPELRANKTRIANQSQRFKRYVPHASNPLMAGHIADLFEAQSVATVKAITLVEAFATQEAHA